MTVRGKETGKQTLPPGTPAPMPFITKTINTFPILSPSLRQESIFFSCGSLRPSQLWNHLAGVLRTHFQHGNNTPSKLSKHTFFPKQIRRISSLYRTVYEGMKPWHTDTYRYLFFIICSRFKKKP